MPGISRQLKFWSRANAKSRETSREKPDETRGLLHKAPAEAGIGEAPARAAAPPPGVVAALPPPVDSPAPEQPPETTSMLWGGGEEKESSLASGGQDTDGGADLEAQGGKVFAPPHETTMAPPESTCSDLQGEPPSEEKATSRPLLPTPGAFRRRPSSEWTALLCAVAWGLLIMALFATTALWLVRRRLPSTSGPEDIVIVVPLSTTTSTTSLTTTTTTLLTTTTRPLTTRAIPTVPVTTTTPPPMAPPRLALTDVAVLVDRKNPTTVLGALANKSCALVGSSSLLSGKRHGRIIDSHDLVIRVNRLPTDEYVEDFGRRTDVLFSNALEMYSGQVLYMGGAHSDCYPPHCDFKAMFFRSDTAGCNALRLMQTWGHPPFLLGCSGQVLTRVAYSFKSLLSVQPTTGFLAFLMFGPVCHNLNMFGFGGTQSADKHYQWDGHCLECEHVLLDQIAAGEWSKIAFTQARDWVKANLSRGPGGPRIQRVVT